MLSRTRLPLSCHRLTARRPVPRGRVIAGGLPSRVPPEVIREAIDAAYALDKMVPYGEAATSAAWDIVDELVCADARYKEEHRVLREDPLEHYCTLDHEDEDECRMYDV